LKVGVVPIGDGGITGGNVVTQKGVSVTVLEHSRMSRAYVACMSEDQTKRARQREKLLESLGRHPTSNELETVLWVY